jgi:hypothetical protein
MQRAQGLRRKGQGAWGKGCPKSKPIIIPPANIQVVADEEPAAPHRCPVCKKPLPEPGLKYCPRCNEIIDSAKYLVALMIAALIEAYDEKLDAFKCFHSGAVLNRNDPDDPFYLVFDHYNPGEPRLVVSAAVMNKMKEDLLNEEWRTVVPMLSDHMEKGKPFDQNCVKFVKWPERWEFPTPPGRLMLGAPVPKPCRICKDQRGPGRKRYCERCARLIQGRAEGRTEKAIALVEALDEVVRRFKCFHCGVLVDDTTSKSPWSANFDHITPGQKRVVVSAAWVNQMKSYLTAEEFRAVLLGLTNWWRHGMPFDTTVVNSRRYSMAAKKGR